LNSCHKDKNEPKLKEMPRFLDFGLNDSSMLVFYQKENSFAYFYCELKDNTPVIEELFELPSMLYNRKSICKKDSSIIYSCNGILYKFFLKTKNNITLFDAGDTTIYFNIWDFNFDKILLTSNLNGNCDIYIMLYDGTLITNITMDTTYERWPEFSLDNSKIVYQANFWDDDWSNTTHHIEIFSINVDGTNKQNLSNIPPNIKESHEYPSFSNDGSMILYLRHVDFYHKYICLMNSDGSNKHNLTDSTLIPYGRYYRTELEGLSWTKNNNEIYFQKDFGYTAYTIYLTNNMITETNFCTLSQSNFSNRFNRFTNSVVYFSYGQGLGICINKSKFIILAPYL